MNWLIWRQYKKQFIFMSMAVIAYAIILLAVGQHAANGLRHTLASGTTDRYEPNLATIALPELTILLPLILGMFWGAPLIAKEYVENTNKLAWTQGITRRKWLASKLGWMIGMGALYGVILSTAATLCNRTLNSLEYDRFATMHFSTQGVMPIVYATFAITLGAFAGAGLRRVLPALAITAALFIVTVSCIMAFVRPHYMPALTTKSFYTNTPTQTGDAQPRYGTAWAIRRTYKVDPGSKQCSSYQGHQICSWSETTDKTFYQPANRYWLFQGIEAFIYLVLSAALVRGTYWLILRRDV